MHSIRQARDNGKAYQITSPTATLAIALGVLEVGVRQRVRRDRERLYFKTNDIQMAVIVFVKFVNFVANNNK